MSNPLAERARWHLSREAGAVIKDHGQGLRFALVYPNTYYVGMSNLGVHAVYQLLNARPDVICERAFMPDRGYDSADRRLPLAAIESQSPLDRFDVIGFSLSFELDYINVVDALQRARVPVFARDRDQRHPVIIAGGPCAAFNPEPLAEVVDAFVVGEAEPALDRVADALIEAQDRTDALQRLQAIRGVYVPSLYEPEYSPQGDFVRLTPAKGAPKAIRRLLVKDVDRWPTHSRVLSTDTEFGNMFLIEISRGCAHACKFCVTAPCHQPYRQRSAQHVLDIAAPGLDHRRTVGLVAAAVTDHPQLKRIVRGLREMKARISLSSMRADGASTAVVEALGESGARSITFAPEAGTDKLRRRLRKSITEQQYLAAARLAAANGIRRLRLYFMLGLPGETEADVEAIPRLVHRLRRDSDMAQVTASINAFVPKPQTAFEREAMAPVRYLQQQLKTVRSLLHTEPGVNMTAESPNWSFIQAALARGDRRLGAVIARACEGGGSLAAWREAFAAEGLDPEHFASRARGPDEPLPWAHIG
ncbi:MAG: radical SAM protein [Armatimonadota bacterium]|nr:MAG: radical SAM protein [Armatimonadota bacterium]